MSAFSQMEHTVSCDGHYPGGRRCRNAIRTDGSGETVAEVRAFLAAQEWAVDVGPDDVPADDRSDFCPDHKPAPEITEGE